jgi:hypothetical protein
METRTYRPVVPSDLPNVQSGKLKAFWQNATSEYKPARLVSTRILGIGERTTMWIIDDGDMDLWLNGLTRIVVDVTPAKRYAVWNHKGQRFCAVDAFKTRQDAEIWRDNYYDKKVHDNFYVVEWEIKEEM